MLTSVTLRQNNSLQKLKTGMWLYELFVWTFSSQLTTTAANLHAFK